MENWQGLGGAVTLVVPCISDAVVWVFIEKIKGQQLLHAFGIAILCIGKEDLQHADGNEDPNSDHCELFVSNYQSFEAVYEHYGAALVKFYPQNQSCAKEVTLT